MKIIKNATIYTMNAACDIIEGGSIIIDGCKIKEVGLCKNYRDSDFDEIFDAQGSPLMPGLVDAHSHIGLIGDAVGFESDDINEINDPVLPQLSALDAVNPLDKCFSEAYEAGITTVATGPGSANAIGGTFIAMKTFGRRADDMIIKAPIAVKMALGENPKCCYHSKGDSPETRMSTAALIREQLQKAKRYLESLEEYENAEDNSDLEKPEFDAKCEALLPLLKGEIPAHIHAHRSDDIFTAIRIAKSFGLKYKIVHCTEGHLIADILGKEHCEAFVGPIICDRSKPELSNSTTKNAALLYQSGVKISIITDHPELVSQYLLLSADVAFHSGLDYMESLRAITINPAQMLDISDRVGSIEISKDADIVIFDKEIAYHSVKKVMINGKFVK